jgi:hypothetical protein
MPTNWWLLRGFMKHFLLLTTIATAISTSALSAHAATASHTLQLDRALQAVAVVATEKSTDLALNPQPIPPRLNPQPLPPRFALNPQPIPPRR